MDNGRPSQAAIEAAGEAAWSPTSRFTVDELGDQIRNDPRLNPIHARLEAER